MGTTQKEHKRIAWSTIQPKPISYLWNQWLPFGKLSLLVGDPGTGNYEQSNKMERALKFSVFYNNLFKNSFHNITNHPPLTQSVVRSYALKFLIKHR